MPKRSKNRKGAAGGASAEVTTTDVGVRGPPSGLRRDWLWGLILRPLALAGAGLALSSDFALPKIPWLQPALCAGLLIILGMASWHRTSVYESGETFWTDTLAKNPNCWAGYDNLGLAFLEQGKVNEACEKFQKALAINPN